MTPDARRHLDAIARIRDFALASQRGGDAVDRGLATLASSFEQSRRPARAARARRLEVAPHTQEPSEEEVSRVVRPYGLVVRFDATARHEGRPSLKLYRFADRCHPVKAFVGFADLMRWLTKQPHP